MKKYRLYISLVILMTSLALNAQKIMQNYLHPCNPISEDSIIAIEATTNCDYP